MPDPQEISRYCSGLVAVVLVKHSSRSESPGRVELQLAHFSVQEYLLSNPLDGDIARDFQECCARAAIAKIYLAYLLQFEEKMAPKEMIQNFPFVLRISRSPVRTLGHMTCAALY